MAKKKKPADNKLEQVEDAVQAFIKDLAAACIDDIKDLPADTRLVFLTKIIQILNKND